MLDVSEIILGSACMAMSFTCEMFAVVVFVVLGRSKLEFPFEKRPHCHFGLILVSITSASLLAFWESVSKVPSTVSAPNRTIKSALLGAFVFGTLWSVMWRLAGFLGQLNKAVRLREFMEKKKAEESKADEAATGINITELMQSYQRSDFQRTSQRIQGSCHELLEFRNHTSLCVRVCHPTFQRRVVWLGYLIQAFFVLVLGTALGSDEQHYQVAKSTMIAAITPISLSIFFLLILCLTTEHCINNRYKILQEFFLLFGLSGINYSIASLTKNSVPSSTWNHLNVDIAFWIVEIAIVMGCVFFYPIILNAGYFQVIRAFKARQRFRLAFCLDQQHYALFCEKFANYMLSEGSVELLRCYLQCKMYHGLATGWRSHPSKEKFELIQSWLENFKTLFLLEHDALARVDEISNPIRTKTLRQINEILLLQYENPEVLDLKLGDQLTDLADELIKIMEDGPFVRFCRTTAYLRVIHPAILQATDQVPEYSRSESVGIEMIPILDDQRS